MSGWKLDTEETCKQRKSKNKEATALEVTGAADENPIVGIDCIGRGL